MTSYAIFVCTNESEVSCEECGRIVEPVGEGQWVNVSCGDSDGIEGRYVSVTASTSYLQIAEVQIYTTGLYFETTLVSKPT